MPGMVAVSCALHNSQDMALRGDLRHMSDQDKNEAIVALRLMLVLFAFGHFPSRFVTLILLVSVFASKATTGT
jgi:hypothetical protein